MADEICIPMDRVPREIYEKLRAIGLLVQSETPMSTSSTSEFSSSLTPYLNNDYADDTDDVDGYRPPSRLSSVVPVIKSDVTSYESVLMTNNDDDVVSIFAPRPSTSKDNQSTSPQTTKHEQHDSDVISLFGTMLSPARQPQCKNSRQGQPSPQQQHQQSNSSPQKSSAPHVSQSSQQYSTSSYNDVTAQSSSPSQKSSAPHVSRSSSQQYLTSSYHDVSAKRSSPSPHHLQQSFSFPQSHEAAEEFRQLHTRSPPRTPIKRCRNPSVSESSYAPDSTLSSSLSPQSSLRPRSSPSCFSDDDVAREISAFSATPSVECGPRSPKMLTPPETPESAGKRVFPEIFTFDDAACARYRQLSERYQQQLQEQQFTPTKRPPSTPRKLTTAPSTPSYRRPEVPRSPSVHSASRRLSPVDQRLLQCFEAAASAPSPQPKKKALEVPDSPSASMQRISLQEYPSPSPQRRDSLSPQPKKRLDFEEDSVSPRGLQPQMWKSYDPNGQPYPLPSPRCMAGGSEHPFTFPTYSMDGQQYGSRTGGPSKAALFRELRKRMDFLAAYQDGDGEDEEDGGDSASQYGFAPRRSPYEPLDFQAPMAPQGERYSTKRRRQDPETDGSDDMLMCTCATMERNFLQMAEGAYTRIRRMDNSPEDFDRFRTELAQTNEILRESMGLMKHIRDLCDHRKRPRR
ncbi:uncharacterized protein [Littorina saxatilis]|uniref:Uncharacterized protein n=1 Tax=Littorina saxatilis TaxID=31220 RepID=A0AAN9B6X4_9CAEN